MTIVNDKMKKTSISSMVCLDIIDFSKKSEAEQLKAKEQLHALINQAVLDIPDKDCLVVDTENGAVITCNGLLESALEDALFIALTIRDEILNSNVGSESPLYLLMAINLGSAQLDKHAQTDQPSKILGDGLEETQRIMSFANPNQILVSRAYYDMASKLTLEIAQMFEKYDMHAYEDDIYAVRRLNEKSVVENAAAALDHIEKPQEVLPEKRSINWHMYALPILLALIMVMVLYKWMLHDKAENQQNTTDVEIAIDENPSPFTIDTLPDPLPEIEPETESNETASSVKSQDKSNTVNKRTETKVKPKPKEKPASSTTDMQAPIDDDQETESLGVEAETIESSEEGDKFTWESIKDSVKTGAEAPCSQAQKALNQCE